MKYSDHLTIFSEEMHTDMKEEIIFFHQIANGDVQSIEKNISDRKFRTMGGMGKLSGDPLTNIKYHMVVTAAIAARVCIENGMEPEMALRMSDYYIQKLDFAGNEDEVEKIHDIMVMDYTTRMRHKLHIDKFSVNVKSAINYIYAHLAERITINILAKHVGVSTSLLSKKFSEETGQSIGDFIRDKKIEMSQAFLADTNMSIMEIAYQLSFSSQSHYIQAFKKKVGVTPKQYRAQSRQFQWGTFK